MLDFGIDPLFKECFPQAQSYYYCTFFVNSIGLHMMLRYGVLNEPPSLKFRGIVLHITYRNGLRAHRIAHNMCERPFARCLH